MALRLEPRLVDQDAGVGVEPREREAHMLVQQADLRRGDARVLELHGGALLAAEDHDGGALDADGAGPALDGLLGVFDLEDVAIGTAGGLGGGEGLEERRSYLKTAEVSVVAAKGSGRANLRARDHSRSPWWSVTMVDGAE